MSEFDPRGPIPVLLVGEGVARIVPSLVRGLEAAGHGTRFCCASFESASAAARASDGAPHLVVIAVGSRADSILVDDAWQAWFGPGKGVARIALSDDLPSPDRGALERPTEGRMADVYRLPLDQAEALPMATVIVSQLIETERSRADLSDQLATERACVPLASCLDPGKLYSMALELLLERLGRNHGIAFFSSTSSPQGVGVVARGFDDATRDRLCRFLIEEKSLESTMGQGEVAVMPWGPLNHALSQIGHEPSGALLSIPLAGDESETGHIWVLSEGRRFGEADLETVRTIARRASAALATAERYHHAKERAFIDDVTGVYNARYLLATADNEIQRAARYGNPLSVLFLDLDRFKLVNDRYGHLIGSDTLRSLSKLLGDCVRQVDTLARYGGDEFTILLVDTPHDVALRIAERIRSRVESHGFEAGRAGNLQLTISIGVATCPEHGEERGPLLDAADKAMYRAKSEGRNRVASANDLRGASADIMMASADRSESE